MSTDPQSFHYRFLEGSSGAAPLLLLHGTGGNEDDLIPLAQAVAPGRTVLSPRGQVLENGMPRFFRRLAEGVFDEQDLMFRTHELADFIGAQNVEKPVALGFSNGANIAAALLMLRPDVLSGAVLLRAMTPFKTPPEFRLSGTPVLLVSGEHDPILPLANAKLLADQLSQGGARVDHEGLPAGHNLTQADLALATRFLNRKE
ncbi:alpha/beta hydrolase [Aestuariivirga sp.]|uniref:alpha/beta hydrolase n=1 Tax=Aestuariivirga sp. TaxID=2650926 RepID=UPI0039E6D01A